MPYTEVGLTTAGQKVVAATDSAGPQVIVINDETHLLSKPLKDHDEAVKLAEQVVANGTNCYPDWYDLLNGGVGLGLFAVFGGDFR